MTNVGNVPILINLSKHQNSENCHFIDCRHHAKMARLKTVILPRSNISSKSQNSELVILPIQNITTSQKTYEHDDCGNHLAKNKFLRSLPPFFSAHSLFQYVREASPSATFSKAQTIVVPGYVKRHASCEKERDCVYNFQR